MKENHDVFESGDGISIKLSIAFLRHPELVSSTELGTSLRESLVFLYVEDLLNGELHTKFIKLYETDVEMRYVVEGLVNDPMTEIDRWERRRLHALRESVH